jgi:hypothetical protein
MHYTKFNMFEESLFRPVGKLTLYFGELETQFCELIALLCRCDFQVAHALVAPLSLSQKVDTLNELVEYCKDQRLLQPSLISELEKLPGQINTVAASRNIIVHGMLLKMDKGDYFVKLSGRPLKMKTPLPADPGAIDKLADDTMNVAKDIHSLIFKIQGYEPTESHDITLPVLRTTK